MNVKTRERLQCPVFGSPSRLSGVVLPTYENTMKYYISVKNNLKSSCSGQEPSVADINEIVSREVEEIWSKASIPVVSHHRVLHMLRAYHDKYKKVLKPIKNKQRQNREKSQDNVNRFRNESKVLFDIAACKCKLFTTCTCAKDRKVPTSEQQFLCDQRNDRLMVISSIDRKASKKINEKLKRKSEEQKRAAKYARSAEDGKNIITSYATDVFDTSESSSEDDLPLSELRVRLSNVGTNSQPEIASTSGKKTFRLSKDMPTLARACDRYGISDRSAAALASAVLQDFGLITESDSVNVVDRNKVRRSRHKKRLELQESENYQALRSLYFDGRKDQTITNVSKGTRWHRKKIVEEHLSLIEEPGSKYIGHITPKSGTSDDIKNAIIYFLKERLT